MIMKNGEKTTIKRITSLILAVLMVFGVFTVIPNVNYTVSAVDEYSSIATKKFNGHTYAVYDIGMTWHEAKAYCENLGGYLATITSQEEQNFIENLIKSGGKNHYWLGGTDEEIESEWKWITSEQWEYTNWDIDEPNNVYSSEHYAQLYREPNPKIKGSLFGKWNDISANCTFPNQDDYFHTTLTGFICEYDSASDIPADAIHITNANILTIDWAQSGKYYVLDEDINLTSEWVPINNFSGSVFDGQGYSINNLYVLESSQRQYAGLFGRIRANNVLLKNININIGSQGVSAYFNTQIYNGYEQAYAGGLVGNFAINGVNTIINCHVTGNIFSNGINSYSTAGGLVGLGSNIKIEKSSAIVNVIAINSLGTVAAIAGGLIGELHNKDGIATITNSYSMGSISAHGKNISYAGGLIGWYNNASNINLIKTENCYTTSNISISNNNPSVGGFIGRRTNSSSSVILNCYRLSTQTFTGNYIDTSGTPLTPEQMRTKASFVGWDFINVWTIDPAINDGFPYLRHFGSGTSSDEILWDTPFAVTPNSVALDGQISVAGVIDGNGKKIQAIEVNAYMPATDDNPDIIGGALYRGENLNVDTFDLSTVLSEYNLPSNAIFAEGTHRIRVWVKTEDMENGVLAGSQDISVTSGISTLNFNVEAGDGVSVERVNELDEAKQGLFGWLGDIAGVVNKLFKKLTMGLKSGETMTLRAEVEDGYEFAGWYDENDNLLSDEEVYVVNNSDLNRVARVSYLPEIKLYVRSRPIGVIDNTNTAVINDFSVSKSPISLNEIDNLLLQGIVTSTNKIIEQIIVYIKKVDDMNNPIGNPAYCEYLYDVPEEFGQTYEFPLLWFPIKDDRLWIDNLRKYILNNETGEYKITVSAKSEGATNAFQVSAILEVVSINVDNYFNKTGMTNSSSIGKYVGNNIPEEERNIFLRTLLSTRNVSQNVYQNIYDLMFVAQYRPNIFGGYDINNWEHQNYPGTPGYSISDGKIDKVNWTHGCAGCFSYALFCAKYVHGNDGSANKKELSEPYSASNVKEFLNENANPGEHIRYKHSTSVHSILYLAEDGRGLGFYFLSYFGGKYLNKNTGEVVNGCHTIRLEYITYEQFSSLIRSLSVWKTDNPEGIANKIIIKAACPIDIVISLNDEELNSATNKLIASFGTMNIVDVDDGKNIEIELDYNENYIFKVIGKGSGSMDLTIYYDTPENNRTFLAVGLTENTIIETSPFHSEIGMLLNVSHDGDNVIDEVWYSHGEPANEPDDEFDTMYQSIPSDVILDAEMDYFKWDIIKGMNSSQDNVISNLNLPTVSEYGGLDVIWISSEPAVISPSGIVTRQNTTKTVILTAFMVLDDVRTEIEFILVVPALLNEENNKYNKYFKNGDTSAYTIEENSEGNGYIVEGINAGDMVENLISKLADGVNVYKNNTLVTSGKLGTGMTIRHEEDDSEITIVIKGDVTGNGSPGLRDLRSFMNYTMNGAEYDEAQKLAVTEFIEEKGMNIEAVKELLEYIVGNR